MQFSNLLRLILLVAYFSLSKFSLGQNLVPNSSFEEYIGEFPCNYSLTASEFSDKLMNWYAPTKGTSDIHGTNVLQTCYTYALEDNLNFERIGFQEPYEGDVMIGIITYGANCSSMNRGGYREYASVKLDYPLQIGMEYYAEMYVSHADLAEFSHNNIGMFFSVDSIFDPEFCGVINAQPQINYEEIIYESENWFKICGSFVANDSFQFLTIGNFYSNNDLLIDAQPDENGSWGLYFIDEIKVRPSCEYNFENFFIDMDTVLCPGDTISISAPQNVFSYLWSDGSSTETFNIVAPGAYWIEVEHDCGSTFDSISIENSEPIFIDLGEDQLICFGDSVLLDVTTPFSNYLWQNDSNSAAQWVKTEGIYSVHVDNNCYNSFDEIEITFNPEIIIDFPDDFTLCKSDSIILAPNVFNSEYLWQDGSTNKDYLVTSGGLYTVEVYQNECQKLDSVFIEEVLCELIIDVPNVFSPNGDNINDIFIPFNLNLISQGELHIFNRWGEIVYSSDNLFEGWDGSSGNFNCSTGTYFYIIEYIDINGNLIKISGQVMLFN